MLHSFSEGEVDLSATLSTMNDHPNRKTLLNIRFEVNFRSNGPTIYSTFHPTVELTHSSPNTQKNFLQIYY